MSDCILWTRATGGAGYGKIKRGGKFWIAPRWFWTQAHGPIPEGMHVLHRCDVRLCVNVEHLFLGTHADNMADRQAKGRTPRGEQVGTSKLMADQVRAIRAEPRTWGSSRRLARKYGVSDSTISLIRSGAIWPEA